jgi:hypothetical protein
LFCLFILHSKCNNLYISACVLQRPKSYERRGEHWLFCLFVHGYKTNASPERKATNMWKGDWIVTHDQHDRPRAPRSFFAHVELRCELLLSCSPAGVVVVFYLRIGLFFARHVPPLRPPSLLQYICAGAYC